MAVAIKKLWVPARQLLKLKVCRPAEMAYQKSKKYQIPS